MKASVIFVFWTMAVLLHAEDWTTTDGKVYKDIKVMKVEPDAVSILDSDGGARVPLSNLNPELQKRFHYDPAAAAVAAQKFAADEKAADEAIAAERSLPPPTPAFGGTAPAPAASGTPAATGGITDQERVAIQEQIAALQNQIANVQKDLLAVQAAEQASFNSHIHSNQNGDVEHRYTMGHSQQEADDNNQIASLQNQIAILQSKLNGGPTPPASSFVSTPSGDHHGMDDLH